MKTQGVKFAESRKKIDEIVKMIYSLLQNQKFKDFMIKLLLILSFMGATFGGCHYLNQKAGLPDDNVIEELIEELIESKTGLEIDLTPGDDF